MPQTSIVLEIGMELLSTIKSLDYEEETCQCRVTQESTHCTEVVGFIYDKWVSISILFSLGTFLNYDPFLLYYIFLKEKWIFYLGIFECMSRDVFASESLCII